MQDKASAASLAVQATNTVGLIVAAHTAGDVVDARRFDVSVPKARTVDNAHIYEDAKRMSGRAKKLKL
ncbi:hypothetical protein FJ420_25040 [Mesorhizobium sp. B3-1-3]|uniref:hypothetical protein n=1 Tax=unclassified Mesorhizobium TaxID=325217 RepID=UPI0011264BA0|nr:MULTISPECIES: hypothetical protein [unclassified Mesorhizobium]TPI61210.1 hypothetical protein FJ424_22920 [Mesorhizobium sp. B3-1-8]TPI66377.1 hypothetical protein FJ420_25040 [Mesorhizobium sp. B3-1-3]